MQSLTYDSIKGDWFFYGEVHRSRNYIAWHVMQWRDTDRLAYLELASQEASSNGEELFLAWVINWTRG